MVLESGAAGYFGLWGRVQQEVGKHTRVVSYDRAGLGFSGKAAGTKDAESIARQLDELLSRAGEKPPYFLVGHRFGAPWSWNTHIFILKDVRAPPGRSASSGPDETKFRTSQIDRNFRRFFHTAAAASHFGVMRVADLLWSMTEGLSESERARARMYLVSNGHLKASARPSGRVI